MSLSPFLTPFKHHVTLPLWHQGQRADQKATSPPFSPHVEESFCRSDIYWSDQAPPEFMLILQTYFPMKYMTLWTSYHQRLILTSIIHPSGFTYETQLPNQVGLQLWLSYPTKSVYKIWLSYPTKWVYKFDTSLHDWILQFYIMGLNKTFSSNYKYEHLRPTPRKSSRKRTFFRTIIMPTMHYTQQR